MSLCWKLSQVVDNDLKNPGWTGSGLSSFFGVADCSWIHARLCSSACKQTADSQMYASALQNIRHQVVVQQPQIMLMVKLCMNNTENIDLLLADDSLVGKEDS